MSDETYQPKLDSLLEMAIMIYNDELIMRTHPFLVCSLYRYLTAS